MAGLFWEPLGVAAAGATLAYFLLATGAHIGARDVRGLATPLAVAPLAAAALALQILRVAGA